MERVNTAVRLRDLSEGVAPGGRVWAEVNLDHLRHNFRMAERLAGKSEVMPVIKADAYGHGSIQVARFLSEEGARRFAVATAEEALQLRRHRIAQEILLLGEAPKDAVRELAAAGITVTVGSREGARACSEALCGARISVHVKFDTGMRRLGFEPGDTAVLTELAQLPALDIKGIYTHFADADNEQDPTFAAEQFARFLRVCEQAESGYLRHCANSAAVLAKPHTHLDLVRPGIMLYGYHPAAKKESDLRPVMSLRASILRLHRVKAGETVGYGRTWTAPGDRLIATVPVGYADGFFRGLSGKTELLVKGIRVPQVGRICMDLCMLDVTEVPGVLPGDQVTILGEDGGDRITADDLAEAVGTISYEVLCAVAKRVPRVYLREGALLHRGCDVDDL